MRIRDVALPALTCALLVGTAQLAAAPPAGAATASWTADLGGGEAAGVVVDGGTARLDRAGSALLPSDADGAPVPTGLLTLDARGLPAPTDRIAAAVDGDLPTGSTAAVDVRGRRAGGGWTEWVPAVEGVAALPERVREVQTRLVLAGAGDAVPEVRDVALTALPAAARAEALPAAAPQAQRVFATREGLVGGTTANGHVIRERDHFVALPSRRALSPRGTGDYSVEVCSEGGRCAFAPVWDVGPWNTRDDYWNPPAQRQEWKDLPQGLPQAQAAHADGYNGGRDQYGREVRNPAGIDLGDGVFWDALGLRDNSWVTVDHLWTGSRPLSPVAADRPVDVRAAPAADAAVVGVAAPRAAVPVECATTEGDRTWLRIGQDQYLDAAAVPGTMVGPCPGGATDPAPDPADPADPADGPVADEGAAPADRPTEEAGARDAADTPATGTPTTGVPATGVPDAPAPACADVDDAIEAAVGRIVDAVADGRDGTTAGPAPEVELDPAAVRDLVDAAVAAALEAAGSGTCPPTTPPTTPTG